jgi:hypothetical protein
MSMSPSSKRPPSQQIDEDSQGIEVVVEVRGDRKTKHLVIVRQALGIKNGKLVLVGPKKEDRVLTYEWIANKTAKEVEIESIAASKINAALASEAQAANEAQAAADGTATVG